MRPNIAITAALCAMTTHSTSLMANSSAPADDAFRPPSVPLVVHDPYFSIWSPADNLTDTWPTHWTGRAHAMQSMIRVRTGSGSTKVYRLMGPRPAEAPAMRQTGLEVSPTTTVYSFEADDITVKLTFCSPLLPNDLDLLSRPVSYVTWEVASTSGDPVDATIRFDLVGEAVVNHPGQEVQWSEPTRIDGGLIGARIGSKDQPILGKSGDDLRIDWGWGWVATPAQNGATVEVLPADRARAAFVEGAGEPRFTSDEPRAAESEWAAITVTIPLGNVGKQGRSAWTMVAYDDEWSITYFNQKLRPYWRRDGMDAIAMLAKAAKDRDAVIADAGEFDRELMDELTKAGGTKYAKLAALAYRQAIGGNKLAADANGKPLLFPKENFSNGCIATVDVIYPMAPLFLATSPDLARAMLVPVLDYGASTRWKFPFAPHDLGTYPHATGQVYGGGERTEENQMPVEESANLILLVAAVCKTDGSTDLRDKYWPTLVKWAEYLREKGYDPENQLCTDDFTGHLGHNVNLSAKAILALGAYAWMLEERGDAEQAKSWRAMAQQFATRWVKEATEGEKTLLAFDRPGSWSQKYNLIWDNVLDLNLFPAEVKKREVAWYRKIQQPFGLPLDNRADFTKTDWTHWSALLSGDRADFEALIAPMYDLANQTPDRVPLSDWMRTKEPRKENFVARPVVGGYFMPMLANKATWKKWAAKGSSAGGAATGWAPIPISAK